MNYHNKKWDSIVISTEITKGHANLCVSVDVQVMELLALLHVVRPSPPESARVCQSPADSGRLWRTLVD